MPRYDSFEDGKYGAMQQCERSHWQVHDRGSREVGSYHSRYIQHLKYTMIAGRVIATPSMYSNANTDTTATFLLLFIHDTVNIEVLSNTIIAITIVTILTGVLSIWFLIGYVTYNLCICHHDRCHSLLFTTLHAAVTFH